LSAETRTVHLQVDVSGQRLDRYLAESLPDTSRAQLQRLIRQGLVTLDGQTVKPSAPVEPGMRVTVCIPSSPPTTIIPESIALDILYEDDDVLVIDKPVGMVVHPAAGHRAGTLVNALLARYPSLAVGDEERPGIVHRLDRDTSGLMVVAKTTEALEHLRRQFNGRHVQKTYLALVYGHPPAAEGIVEAPLGRDPIHRQRMAVVPGGRTARTRYRCLAQPGDFSLLSVQLETGRTHQIRVHLAWLGIPVVGDRVYGRRRSPAGVRRQLLHAWRLCVERPGGRGTLEVTTPPPGDLQDVLHRLGCDYVFDAPQFRIVEKPA
jgi:23S rRNA pseudouridine1911/1915/1917 synthase